MKRMLYAVFCLLPLVGASGEPVFSIRESEYRFAPVAQGEDAVGEFAVENSGDDDLQIELAASCRCLLVFPRSQILSPGQKAVIKFRLDTVEYEGEVKFAILAGSNDPELTHAYFTITGCVMPGTLAPAPPDDTPVADPPAGPAAEIDATGFFPGVLHANTLSFVTFSQCSSCRNLWEKITFFAGKTGKRAVLFPLEEEANRKSLAVYCAEKGLYPELPILFADGQAYSGEGRIEAFLSGKEQGVVPAASSGSDAPSPGVMNLPLLFAAGLLDGINPCAFTMIIILVSYLTLTMKSAKTVLLSGVFYIVAVFVSYLLIGLGLFGFFRLLDGFALIGLVIKYAITAFLFVLAILSLVDWISCRNGKIDKVILKLPEFLDKTARSAIRSSMRDYRIVAGSAALGFFLSIVELVCTGQVYFPVIGYLARSGSGIGLLFLYNTGFILPLAGVFVLVCVGVSARKIGDFFRRRVSLVKLCFAAFFAVFGLINLFV